MPINITGYTKYLTADGDTFDLLALRNYGEEQLSSVIIQANPEHADVLIFEQKITIQIPEIENIETPETLPPWRRAG